MLPPGGHDRSQIVARGRNFARKNPAKTATGNNKDPVCYGDKDAFRRQMSLPRRIGGQVNGFLMMMFHCLISHWTFAKRSDLKDPQTEIRRKIRSSYLLLRRLRLLLRCFRHHSDLILLSDENLLLREKRIVEMRL